MKQKLFENVSGNQFRLMTESADPKAGMIREGLKKVFASANGKGLSYKSLQNFGLGFIKDVTEARKCALQEARDLAPEFGYRDNEKSAQFVRENDFSKLDAQNPEHRMATRSSDELDGNESDMSNPEEAREVQIGHEILDAYNKYKNDPDKLKEIVLSLAQELLDIHNSR
jgi:hypothetical protein